MPYKDPEKQRVYRREYKARDRERWREYNRAYYAANKERHLELKREQREREGATVREREKEERDRRRTRLLELLGGRCVRCGYSDGRALCIDHVRGDGAEERRSLKSRDAVYRKVLRTGGEGYQLLCCNCNAIKAVEEDRLKT